MMTAKFQLLLFLSSAIPWVAFSQSISSEKSSYDVGEPIQIGWEYSKRDASNGDWIGIYKDGSLSPQGTLPPGSEMWVYAKSLTQSYQKGKASSGSVTFDGSPPDESGLSSWPLGAGSYRVHIVRDSGAPYDVFATSAVFNVGGNASPTDQPTVQPTKQPTKQPTNKPTQSPTKNPLSSPTRSPTNKPTPSEGETSLSTSKTSYDTGEDIIVDFSYPNNKELDAWIALWPADSNSQSLPSPAPFWNYICSDSQSSTCAAHPTSGTVTLNGDSSGGLSWPLNCGIWKAYLIESGSSSVYYSAIAVSGSFTVGDCASLSSSKTSYSTGEDIVIDFVYPGNPGLGAWMSLWPADSNPDSLPSPSPYWNYVCSDSQSSACTVHPTAGTVTLNADSSGDWPWPLNCGTWKVFLIESGASSLSYSAIASSAPFTVGDSPTCENAVCNSSPEDSTPSNTHLVPVNGAQINKVGFGSCYKPQSQSSSALWEHVRNNFGDKSVWNWLGDNMYQDTNDSQAKRNAYNNARNDNYYSTWGPVAEPKIMTTGTWDDHDYGFNNDGNNYQCRQSSQNEFVYHFNIPESDPRHPAYIGGQQKGIYSSYMFSTSSGSPGGIHLINLDARYHRSPTFSYHGPCEGASSTMLGSEQWMWLESELQRPSVIKVIGSGTQVLPPTYRGRSLSSYCSYDGGGGTFDIANSEVGEDSNFKGTNYESWAEIPQERTKLLKLVQESLNAGNAKQVIFISGDQHWAEIMEKEIPARTGQSAVTVYEVTASGIDQNWPFTVENTNRLRPSDYESRLRRNLAGTSSSAIKSISFTGQNTCSGDDLHICSATSNYGGIEVNWDTNEVHLSIFTPHEPQKEAVRVTLDIGGSFFH